MLMWIKICGIKRIEDALTAQDLGADAIGFIFAPSPRRIDPEVAAEIAEVVHVIRVGVFVNPSMAILEETRRICPLDRIQLHGQERPAFCNAIKTDTIKGLRVRDRGIVEELKNYMEVWKILLDAYVPGIMGGTGRRIAEELLKQIPTFDNIILAGGINADNISDLYRRYRPFGFDISSAVERSPGEKDPKKMKNLFKKINDMRS
jgi:phosphoribosylanthranilate isomerase